MGLGRWGVSFDGENVIFLAFVYNIKFPTIEFHFYFTLFIAGRNTYKT